MNKIELELEKRIAALSVLVARSVNKVARLEAFILKGQEAGTWDMIGESSLQETIRGTVAEDFHVSSTTMLEKNFGL